MSPFEPLLPDERQYLSEIRHLPLLSDVEYVQLAEFDEQGRLGKMLHKRVAWEIVNAIYNTANAIRIPSSSQRYAQKKGRADALPLQPVSLDQMLEHSHREDAESLLDTLQAPAFLLRPMPGCPPDKVHLLALLLSELNPREREVVQLRYGLSDDGLVHSVEEIMARLGVAEQTVHYHERRAMRHIRDLCTTYERETGCPLASLGEIEGLIAFLERRRSEHQLLGTRSRSRVVNAQLHQAFTQMQADALPLTIGALASKAGVSRGSARQYLQRRRHPTILQEIQQRLKAAYTSLRRRRVPITCQRLADHARVSRSTAQSYLKAVRDKEARHGR